MPFLTLGADMARPSRTGGKTSEAKARNASPAKGRKTTKTKPRIAPAATRVKRRSVSDPSKDLKEAREQQAATAEILKVIASSPDDVQPVLEAVAERAMSLLDAWSVLVTRFDGELLHFGAARGALPDTEQFLRNQYPMRPEAAVFAGRCILERSAINISDAQADPSPQNRERARLRGFRAALSVPMLRDGQPIGVITVSRSEAGAFAANEVELLQTFADQAVIAIENVRLFNERTQGGAGAADRHRRHPQGDRQFAVRRAAGIRGHRGRATAHASRYRHGLRLRDGDEFDLSRRIRHASDDCAHMFQTTSRRRRGEARIRDGRYSRAVRSSVPDLLDDPDYIRRPAQAMGLARAAFGVPAAAPAKVAFGVISVDARGTSGHSRERQIELLQTFADQAVIAIENVRLFDEVQAKTRDLSEALTYQTGSGNILSVIASSPTDVDRCCEAIVESACELCDAYDAHPASQGGDIPRISAHHGPIPSRQRQMADQPRLDRRTRGRRQGAGARARPAVRRRRRISRWSANMSRAIRAIARS